MFVQSRKCFIFSAALVLVVKFNLIVELLGKHEFVKNNRMEIEI